MKKKILHIVSGVRLSGGVENYVENLSNGMNKERFEISICSISAYSSKKKVERLLKNNVKVFPLKPSLGESPKVGVAGKLLKNIFIFYILKAISLKKLIAELRPDLIFAHGEEAEFILSFINAAPKVNVIHSEALFPNNPVYRKIVFKERRNFDGTIYVCEKLRGKFSALSTGIEKVIYAGIAIEKFSEIFRKKTEDGIKTKRLGYLGRMSPEKGVSNLQEAFVKIALEMDETEFVFSGDGAELGKIKNQIPEKLKNRFVFTGEISDARDFFSDVDIFVLSSFVEGLPLTALEAMASGAVAIAPNVGGVSEIIIDGVNGFLLPDNKPETIYKKTIAVLEGKYDLLSIAKNAKKTAERFSVKVTAESFEKFINEILKND
jgi:glycosyltransferase involved in cell wall biosynthesis